MSRMCKVYHCLPQAGGLFDQDPFLIKVMEIVTECDHEVEEAEAERRKREHEAKLKQARR